VTTACVGSLGWARWADLFRLLIGLPTPAVTPHILRAVEESSGPAWRTDIKTAYELFATKHVESLTSRQILEAAFEAMRTRAGSSATTPRFSDVANVVPDDQARFDKATDELLRERPDVAPEDLRSAAIDAMVNLVPDGHTRYWPVWADAPIRDIAEGRCEVRSGCRCHRRWPGTGYPAQSRVAIRWCRYFLESGDRFASLGIEGEVK